jgi:hypothetical protein
VANSLTVTTSDGNAVPVTLTGSSQGGRILAFTVLTQPSRGVLSGAAPTLTYTPSAGLTGDDSFTYSVSDGVSSSAPATVLIHVTPVNHPPSANELTVEVNAGSSVDFSLAGADVDGEPLTFAVASQPGHGTLAGTPPALTYFPAAGFSGTDTFTYVVSEGNTVSAPATVTIHVAAENHAPVASPVSIQTVMNHPVNVALTGSDPDNNPLTYRIVSQPSAGQLSGSGANLVYTPVSNFTGTDSFRYAVSDGTLSSEATVSISVSAPANLPPVASNLSFEVLAGIPFPVTLGGSDPNGDPVTFEIVTPPTKGQLSGTAPRLTYTANSFSSGSDSLSYRVSDGVNQSPIAMVTFNIQGSSNLPAPTTGIQMATDGSVVLKLNGPANHAYQIESSKDAVHWEAIANGSADDSGAAQYRESLPIEHVTLYRVKWPASGQ